MGSLLIPLYGCLSKGDVYTSKVKYILRRGKPYIWVPEKDLHNVVCPLRYALSFVCPTKDQISLIVSFSYVEHNY
jgi:hypothetical protein